MALHNGAAWHLTALWYMVWHFTMVQHFTMVWNTNNSIKNGLVLTKDKVKKNEHYNLIVR